jgi:competence protein CoiA
MRFALINGKRIEAQSGLKGICPGCSKPVIAKCGTQRIHHWAHAKNEICDKWWEPETEWHRSWKNNFPSEWQEIFLSDEKTGEKHIADVCTTQRFVIEFQHSHIDPEERATRERFYKNMLWVVDGTRLKRDYSRFIKNKNYIHPIRHGIFKVEFPEECFPISWLGSSVLVIFDFRNDESVENNIEMKNNLYCLFPNRLGIYTILAVIPCETFINTIINDKWLLWTNSLTDKINQVNQEWQALKAKQQQIQANINFERSSRAYRYQKRRGRF